MTVKAIVLLAGTGIVAACGGSSDGSAVNPLIDTDDLQIVKQFTEGRGLVRINSKEEGELYFVSTVIGDDFAAYKNGAQRIPFVLIDAQSAQKSFTSDSYNEGTTTRALFPLNGEDLPLYLHETLYRERDNAFAMAFGSDGDKIASSGGNPLYGSLPIGFYIYRGKEFTIDLNSGGVDEGFFWLEANFSSMEGFVSLGTISGKVSISETGEISGQNLETNLNGIRSRSGVLEGNFYGGNPRISGTSVGGVYSDHPTDPNIIGSFAASIPYGDLP